MHLIVITALIEGWPCLTCSASTSCSCSLMAEGLHTAGTRLPGFGTGTHHTYTGHTGRVQVQADVQARVQVQRLVWRAQGWMVST